MSLNSFYHLLRSHLFSPSCVNIFTHVLPQRQHSEWAGKITGMLLEIDNAELLHMLEDPASLQAKVVRALLILSHKINI